MTVGYFTVAMKERQARIRLSPLLFTFILDITNWVCVNLVCFDRISLNDNLVR